MRDRTSIGRRDCSWRSQGQASPIITAPSRERDLPSRAEACRDHPRAPGAGLGMETGGSAPPGRFVDRRGGRSRRRARDTVAASAAGAYRAPTQRSRRGRSTAGRAPDRQRPAELAGAIKRRSWRGPISNSVISLSSRQPENLGWRRLPSAIASRNSTSMTRPRTRGEPFIPSIWRAAQISAFENGHSQLQQAKANAIISALDRAGVYFDENGGVFLREPVANDQ